MEDSEDQTVNVQVVVRCRPLNEQEKRIGADPIAFCDQERQNVRLMYGGSKKASKSFTFDRVFGQFSTQEQVFDATVSSIIDEVLQGYNCTVFAYGQTGTGKTYTMEGDLVNQEEAGIIPRSVRTIFSRLENQQRNIDYSIRVSYLELYNEELADLLAPDTPPSASDGRKSMSSLRLCEDIRKGVQVQSLEEVAVLSPEDIFKILERGIEQRRTAETNCNKSSSRSHAIFTLKIQMREDDVIRQGQLNLVDLAGSECIGRSLMTNQQQQTQQVRMREAGSINQSLLTLGRVITALVEHHPHVPYRDSKLTRLLQESLGGRAKTCIIATFSPSADCLEETISTLDYAFRAKNIKNRPEIFQRIDKKCVMKEFITEIDGLKRQLQITREKNGVYVDPQEYDAMLSKIEAQELTLKESEAAMRQARIDKEEMGVQLNDVRIALLGSERDNKLKEEAMLLLNGEISQLKSDKIQLGLDIERKEEENRQLKHQLEISSQKNVNLQRLISDYSRQLETWLNGALKSALTDRISEVNEQHYQAIFCHFSQLKTILSTSIDQINSNLTQVMSSLSVTSNQLICNSLMTLNNDLIEECSNKQVGNIIQQLHELNDVVADNCNQLKVVVDISASNGKSQVKLIMDSVISEIFIDLVDGKLSAMLSQNKLSCDESDSQILQIIESGKKASIEMNQQLSIDLDQEVAQINEQMQQAADDILLSIKDQFMTKFVEGFVKQKCVDRLKESNNKAILCNSRRFKQNGKEISAQVQKSVVQRQEWTESVITQLSDSKLHMDQQLSGKMNEFDILSNNESESLKSTIDCSSKLSVSKLSSVSNSLESQLRPKLKDIQHVMNTDLNLLAGELEANGHTIQTEISRNMTDMSSLIQASVHQTSDIHDKFKRTTLIPAEKELVEHHVDDQLDHCRAHNALCRENFIGRFEATKRKSMALEQGSRVASFANENSMN